MKKVLMKLTNKPIRNYQMLKTFEKGSIPHELKFDRNYQMTELPNGIKVCTEHWPSPLTTRNETAETSGSAHFLEHLHFKGTQKRTRNQLELDVENMGGQLNAYTSRENTSYTMNVFKKNTENALEILGDMLLNSVYSKTELEIERETIYRELVETQNEQMETLTYPKHMIGNPILGNIHNMKSITQEMVIDYHKTHYFGKNIIIVAGGDLEHQKIVDLSEKYFGKCSKLASNRKKILNLEKPEFHSQILLMKADLLEKPIEGINVGVFYEAPHWLEHDYYGFLLLQRLIADKPEHELEAQLYQSIKLIN